MSDLAGVRRRSGKKERESRKVVFIDAVRFADRLSLFIPSFRLVFWWLDPFEFSALWRGQVFAEPLDG